MTASLWGGGAKGPIVQALCQGTRAGLLPEPALELGGGNRTCPAVGFSAVGETDHGGNAADAITCSKLRLGIGVDLRELDAAGEAARSARELGCHRSARPAPCRPEIHDQRHVVPGDEPVERRGGERQRLAREKRSLARAAGWLRISPFRVEAIAGETM